MHDVGVVTVDVVMMMVVSFRTVGVGMIVGVIVAMLCFMLVSVRFPAVMLVCFLLQNHIKVTGIDPAFFRPPDRYFIPLSLPNPGARPLSYPR